MRRSRFSVLLAVLLAVVLAACGSSSTTSKPAPATGSSGAPAATPQTVRIALDYTANVNYLGIYAAIKNGYFAQQGVTAQIIPYAQVPAETLVKAGRTDLGISVPSEVITARAGGLQYKAVAALTATDTTALAVKADGPITRPAQLDGLTYGGFGIASDEPIIKEILRRDGVRNPRFRQVTLNTDAYVALGKGRVGYSAVFGGIDDVTAAAQGVKLRLFPYAKYLGAAGQFPNAVYVASDATIARKGDALRRALAALAQGYQWSAQHPDEAAAILVAANRTELGKAAALTRKEAEAVAPQFVSGGRWGTLTAADFSGLEDILVKGGVVKGTPPTAADLFDASLLPAR